ncbi:diguanylate cyclase [Methanocella sp. CWC-04]|uniref:Diguanylate cyclase n=1 Tax=Methanooceanicella nereidis TaxID=2052831 RepID=A0AAP2W806_9EURY|nr:GAF domain-containing protein [Methanocella sp. CWC-04]MCD1295601.1 diguanylate cyclase [Methanocella sp. CWC-04]
MEELSDTEKLIVSYIESHPPEECMLDKITMGINKSRATVLKYLETLYARGVLEFKFIGRNKLWMLAGAPDKVLEVKQERKAGVSMDIGEMASKISELHMLKYKETELRESIDRPDMIIFSMNRSMDIVSYNDMFKNIFPEANNLRSLIPPSMAIRLDSALSSIVPGSIVSVELDLMEKHGIYRPYRINLSTIQDASGNILGTTAIGEELSAIKRTKRQLEALLYIIRTAGSAGDEKQLLRDTMKGVSEKLLPYIHAAVFLKEEGSIYPAYQTFDIPEHLFKQPEFLLSFLDKCIGSMETLSAKPGDIAYESMRQISESPFTGLFAIPIIDDEKGSGAILLITKDPISSVDLENVEMIADELASGLKMQRLERERSEYVRTLVAMNSISGILNTSKDEDMMLEKAIASTMETLGFDMGCIYIREDDEELMLRAHRNLPENLKNMCISGMFKDLFSKAFEEHELVYITRASKEYDSLDPAIKENNVRTLLILPIKSGDKIIGLLNMGSREEKHYSRMSLENLGSIGLQLGLALERSKLALKLTGKNASKK